MQNTSIIAQKDQIIFESFQSYQNHDNQKVGSFLDNSRLENSSNFYNKGANKRQQLFCDYNAEIEHMKDKKDDDLVDSINQIDAFITRQALNYYDYKSPKNHAMNINSPEGNKLIGGAFNNQNDQYGIDSRKRPQKLIITNKVEVVDYPEEKISPQLQYFRGSNKYLRDSHATRVIKDDNSQNSNQVSINNQNMSNMQGQTNINQSQYFQNNNFQFNDISAIAYKSIKKTNNVVQFFQKMCSLSISYNTRQLKDMHYQLINDLSYSSIKNSKFLKQLSLGYKNKKKVNLISIIKQPFRCFSIANPEDLYCVIWDILYGLSIIVYLFFIPINISFDVELPLLTNIILGFQIVNMFFTFTKGYYEQGHLILNRRKIFINYFKKGLLVDIIIIFILYYYHNLCWIFFIYATKIKNIVLRADNYFQIVRRFPVVFEISHLTISILLIGQITGCGFHFIAKQEYYHNSSTKTWLQIANLSVDDNWIHKYIACEYFAFITMITVGFGDIFPTSTIERVYVIVMTLVSSVVFSYVMNTIGSIFKQYAQRQQNMLVRKQGITTYMNDRNINRSLQIKILKYLDYENSIEKKNNQSIELLFTGIPKNLTQQIYKDYFGSFLLNNKILSLNFSKESLIELSLTVKEKFLQPSEYLIQTGCQEQKVYFLQYGSLDIVIETPKGQSIQFEQIKTIGECIGLKNAFNEDEYSYSIKSSENSCSQLFYFDMKDFKEILSKYSKDYEKYCELKDEITFTQYHLDTKCISCERYNHSVQECPLINHNISKPNTILRYNHTIIQERMENFKRRPRNQYFGNFRTSVEVTRKQAKNFRMQMAIRFFPEYDLFTEQMMFYDDERFAIELHAFGLKDGTLTVFDDEDEEFEEELPQDYNDIQIHFNNNSTQPKEKRKSSDQTNLSHVELALVQQQSNIPLVHSQLQIPDPLTQPQSSLIIQNLLNPPLVSGVSQLRGSHNHIIQVENIMESNNILRDSIKENTNKSLISGYKDRRDSFQANIKKVHNFAPINSTQPTRTKGNRKQTYKQTQMQNQNNQVQEEIPQDLREFFLKNFEMMKNYVKYYPKFNSEIQIKKYNSAQNQKKAMTLKSLRSPLHPTTQKKRFNPRKSVIPSTFKSMAN